MSKLLYKARPNWFVCLVVVLSAGMAFGACLRCFHIDKIVRGTNCFSLDPTPCLYDCRNAPECSESALAYKCWNTTLEQFNCARFSGPPCCGASATFYFFECDDTSDPFCAIGG